jgi:hypothetical protein
MRRRSRARRAVARGSQSAARMPTSAHTRLLRRFACIASLLLAGSSGCGSDGAGSADTGSTDASTSGSPTGSAATTGGSGGGSSSGPATGGATGSGAAASGGDGGETAGAGAGGSPPAVIGIWSSAAELAAKPTSGAAWDAVLAAADGDTSQPDVSDQDDPTNTRVLAAAIVYARTGDAAYQDKVVAACQAAIGTEQGGRSLAWGREAGAYAMAADLVGFSSPDFTAWLVNVADGEKCSQLDVTLREMFYRRPNNWGMMAFGSLTAIYRYLGDDALLEDIRDYWAAGVAGPNPGFEYDDDLSWHADDGDLRLINPVGSMKQGVDIDGLIPDDMRRGASFTTGTPAATGYPWEHLQGVLMAARVLERAGLSIWDVDDQAIRRAAYALQVRIGGSFEAEGDDLWQLAFLDAAYGTGWAGGGAVWGAGKNAGFPYVLP